MSTLRMPDKMWKIHDALTLIRSLQSSVKAFGYHITLGGGVLNTGTSLHDLDIFFHPLERGNLQEPRLLAFLKEFWGAPQEITSQGSPRWSRDARGRMVVITAPVYPPSVLYSQKLFYFYSGLRIDVFVLRLPEAAISAAPVGGEVMTQDEAIERLSREQINVLRQSFRGFLNDTAPTVAPLPLPTLTTMITPTWTLPEPASFGEFLVEDEDDNLEDD